MPHPEQTIKNWIVVGFVFTGIYALFALYFFSKARRTEDYLFAWAVLIITLLFLIGVLSARSGNYSATRVCWLIGGILGIPLGLVMVVGSSKIKKASQELLAAAAQPLPH